jgi:hypothetical protein
MPTPPDFAATLEAALAEAEQASGPRPSCTIGEIIDGLPPDDAERVAGLVRMAICC